MNIFLTSHRYRCLLLALSLLVTPMLSGCGSNVSQDAFADGNRDTSLTSPLGKTAGEPNGSFGSAIIAVFDANDVARLQGTISDSSDLDIFELGAMSAGDRIVVDVATSGSVLDAVIGIYDAQQRLVYIIDDRTDTNLDPLVDFTVRHDSDLYFLVITRAAFASSSRRNGTYTADIFLATGLTPPQPVGQTIILDFEGGLVELATIGSTILDPFDAGAISSVYIGQTETMKQVIRSEFAQNYERFDVTILTSDEPAPVDNGMVSRVHFGGFRTGTFGIADDVDLYNVDFCDDAIIFTETFSPSLFSSTPSATEMAIAIANVASHEAGHLLGLNHVSDDRDLMDDRSAADVFITDQEFMEAPVSRDIIPIGTQDGVLLLNETVGPA